MPPTRARARAGSRQLALRAALPADAPALVSVQQVALDRETAGGARPHPVEDIGFEQAWFRHLLEGPDGRGWVAEVDGRCAGFSLAAARGGITWLVSLFVEPQAQGQGLGRRLLETALGRAGERTRPVATFVDVASARAQLLYRAAGLHTVACALALAGPPQKVRREKGLAMRPVEPTDAAALETLDVDLRVGPRPAEHAFWEAAGCARRILLDRQGLPQGYAIWSPNGRLGPLAVHRARSLPAALAACLGAMAESGHAHVRAMVPGDNPRARDGLLEHGFRPLGMEVLMTDGRPPDWSRYLIHRAGLP